MKLCGLNGHNHNLMIPTYFGGIGTRCDAAYDNEWSTRLPRSSLYVDSETPDTLGDGEGGAVRGGGWGGGGR